MIKRFTVLFVSLLVLLAVPTSAKANFSIEAGSEFYIYGEDNEKLCETVGITDIDSYCKERNIKYLAVNKDNTRQISLLVEETEFSNSVINLSLLTNDGIKELMPDIIGLQNIKGEILDKNGQKFIKTAVKTQDSGGEYINTQYYTVADKKIYILSFYNTAEQDTTYVQKTFDSFRSDDFITDKNDDASTVKTVVILALIAFGICSLIVLITIVRDIIKKSE